MCRFKSVTDAKSAYEAGLRGDIQIDGIRPLIFELQHPTYSLPVSLVPTDTDLPDLITPNTTYDWESSEDGIEVDDLSFIHLSDPLNSSSHSCELPAIQASNHLMGVTNDEDGDEDDDNYSAPRSMLETYSGGTASPFPTRHHRSRSTAIYDGEPKTYEDNGDDLFQQLHHQRQPTSGVCELQDPSFAEIYAQEQLKSEDTTVHVLCVPEHQQ